jgi:hypothetical protein
LLRVRFVSLDIVFMLYIDTLILNLVEQTCRRIQRLTGRTNVWLAFQLTNLSIIVYFVWAGAVFWTVELVTRIFVALFCGGVLYVLMQTLFKEPIETFENNAFRRVLKGSRNPRRVRDALLRISFLFLAILLFYPVVINPALFRYVKIDVQIPLLMYSLIVLTTAVLYLLACDPLPPVPATQEERAHAPVASQVPAPES